MSSFSPRCRRTCMVFILLAWCMDNYILSQNIPTDTVVKIQEILISAARMSQTADNINIAHQVLSSAKLGSVTSRNLPEALQHHGIWMQKTNQGGGSAFIRGLTGNQVLILKDGIRLNNSIYRYGPNQYLSLQSLYDQQQIEVIKGSGAVQYGSDAIGGVLHLQSIKPALDHDHGIYGNIYTQWATSDIEKIVNARVALSKKDFAISGRGAYLNYGDLRGGKLTGIQSPSGYQEYNTDLKARWFNPLGTWDFSYSKAAQYDVPVYHKLVLEGFEINQSDQLDHQLAYVRNKYVFGNSSFLENLETTFSWQYLHEHRSIQKKTTDPLRIEEDGVQVLGLTSQVQFTPGSSIHAVFGYDVYLDKVRSKAIFENNTPSPPQLRGLYPDGAKYLNAGVFNYWNAGFNKWDLTWGWRWNIYRLKTIDPNLGDITLKPSALVWHGSLGRASGNHRVFLNADKTFRAPNIDDAGTLGIVDFRYEVPNYDLVPEKGLHLSAGYRWTGLVLKMEHGLYYLKLNDLITRTAIKGDSLQGYPVFIKKNSDKSFIYGWESSWDWNINTVFNCRGNFQYTFGQNQTANEPIRRIPPLFYSVWLQYRPGIRWSFYMESINAGSQKRLSAGDLSDNRISKTGTPAWNILNAGLTYRTDIISIRAGIENVFNSDYRIHGSGINGAGRLARLGIQISW